MIYNTEAIVIKSIPYGENNVIVTLLTPLGKISAMARGAKKPQSRLRAGTALCAHGLYSIRQGKGMGTIQQVEILQTHRVLHEQLELAAYAACFCELAGLSAEERPDGNPEVFINLKELLLRVQNHPEETRIMARIWETKILAWLGASPEWTKCVRCGLDLQMDYQYSSRHGGLICLSCIRHESDSLRSYIRVPIQTFKILHQFQKVPIQRIGKIQLSSQTLMALKTVLSMQLYEYAGVVSKTRQVLDSLHVDV